MSRCREPMPYLVSFRLSQTDYDKLHRLCHHARREQGDLLRLLIRMAEPVAGAAVPVRVGWEEKE